MVTISRPSDPWPESMKGLLDVWKRCTASWNPPSLSVPSERGDDVAAVAVSNWVEIFPVGTLGALRLIDGVDAEVEDVGFEFRVLRDLCEKTKQNTKTKKRSVENTRSIMIKTSGWVQYLISFISYLVSHSPVHHFTYAFVKKIFRLFFIKHT